MGAHFPLWPLWPNSASSLSPSVDALMLYLISITGGVTVIIFIVIVVFAWKYNYRRHKAVQIEGSTALELAWSIVPMGIFLTFFAWGAKLYIAEARPPANSLEIYVVAKQWMWKIQHQEGPREINTLTVPVDTDVRLTMISQDVIHSFYVPAFRIKADVLPGRYTTEWFHASKPGHYHLFCAEYCGTNHSGMIGEVDVLDKREYQAWLEEGGAQGTLASTGQKLFQEFGCANCHRFDTQGRGPNLVGVFGKPVLLDDGRTVMADDAYIRESIVQPAAKIVAGFKPIMPTFQGIVTEEQLLALTAYIKSLSTPEQTEPVSSRSVSAIAGTKGQ